MNRVLSGYRTVKGRHSKDGASGGGSSGVGVEEQAGGRRPEPGAESQSAERRLKQ